MEQDGPPDRPTDRSPAHPTDLPARTPTHRSPDRPLPEMPNPVAHLAAGTTYGFNQWAGRRYNMTWDEGRKHIVNKSTRCMPLITRKAKRGAPWWQRRLWSYWDVPDEAGQDFRGYSRGVNPA